MPQPEPTDRETAFRRLLELLDGPVSDRWAVVDVASFLTRLDPQRPETESYLLSLIEPLAETAEGLDPVGLPPGPLVRLADHLQAARASHLALQNLAPARRAEEALRRRAALLYAYAGAMEPATEQLSGGSASADNGAADGPGPESIISDDINEDGLSRETPRDRLRRAREESSATVRTEELRWLEQHWQLGSEDRDGSSSRSEHRAWVPVVERLPSWAQRGRSRSYGPEVGGLRQLAIELYASEVGQGGSKDSDSRDQLWTDLASDENRERLTGGPVAAARDLLNREHPALRGRFFEGRVVADGANLGHEGQSAGLALGGLFYGAALEEAHRRRRLQLRPQVALTGRLTAEGTVEPVDEQGLPTKVQAAFFSPLTTLVVPEEQSAAAERTLDTLQETYPHGDLDIVGVGRLRDVLDHRRLTRKVETGRVSHYAQRIWNRKQAIVASLLIVGLALGLAWALRAPFDRNPVQARFGATTLKVQNAAGQLIEQFRVGERIAGSGRNGSRYPVAFADVAGDAKNEIFWEAVPGDLGNERVLRAKAVGADTLLWERPLRFETPFPGQPEVVTNAYMVQDLLAEDADRDGAVELYCTLRHEKYFPGLLLELDPRAGTVRQRYVHPGYFMTRLLALNLDGDAPKELLAGGYNNAFRDPILAVLDARHLEGHAPTQRPYQVAGSRPASHHAYLRFPASAVQQAAPRTVRKAEGISYHRDQQVITLEYLDGLLEAEDFKSLLLAHLDRQLRPVAMGTSSGHDRLARQLVKEGRLAEVPGPEALRRLQREIQYWTGTGWAAKTSKEETSPAESRSRD